MKAIHTQETPDHGDTGVSPNFGGGLTKDGEGIGKTPKKMKKLTTVFSKNQKLHSFNVPALTKKFERKSNLDNEIRR